jgi:hypothetical protein
MRGLRFGALAAAAALVLSACATASSGDGESAPSEAEVALFVERLDLVDDAVAAWGSATTLEAARAAAETAANLVVGPGGPGYGDRNGDGQIGGEVSAGLLAGLDGLPAGLASALAGNECVVRDVLGGSWEDPGAEWDRMLTAIDAWRSDNNTMPSLPSHPMRIVGWATFTLATDSLELAQEYAGHAKLHVDISRRALDC